jgi:nicotinamide-nucleotide adenylyltransferase
MEAGVEVKSTGLFDRNNLKGSNIRKLMVEGKKWHQMVPKAVLDVIRSIDGLDRLKGITKETD